jgi:hypothetical protein
VLSIKVITADPPRAMANGVRCQQIDRRGNRFVLPIQAKARMAVPFRAAFDYHCRLQMPAVPILPATRADCAF